MRPLLFLLAFQTTLAAQETPARNYVVLVDPGPADAFLPAAKDLADFHKGMLEKFDADNLDGAFARLKKLRPDFVAFVLPPEKIDVDLTHRILELSTTLDEDPFVDFEYGFITGRDGPAASRFVARIKDAWKRDYGRKVCLLGSWEGKLLPPEGPLTALEAMKAEGELKLVHLFDKEETRRKKAQAALTSLKGRDMLLFFSHGFPDEMSACFKAADLSDWKVDLAPAVLINCACYNGCTGRWFAPGPKGVEDKGLVPAEQAVALRLLDSGLPAYFAGIDPWHGPLAMQLFNHVFDDGMRLGEAANRMHNRLALEFLPDKLRFEPTLKTPNRFGGEGTVNRRHNGGGMIFYGDPAWAPFAKSASKLTFADWHKADGRLGLRLGNRPLVAGKLAEDFMLPQSRLLDYYSVRTAEFLKELSLEVYRVVPLPEGMKAAPRLSVATARAGKKDIPTKAVETLLETTAAGARLHVRVPLDVRAFGTEWPFLICLEGMVVELE